MPALLVALTVIITSATLAGLNWFFPTLAQQLRHAELFTLAILLFTAFVINTLMMLGWEWWQRRILRSTISKLTAQIKTERDFVSLAAHQLRTPLSALKWSLNMFRREEVGPLTPEQTGFVTQIETTNDQLVALVNDLLNVSRIEDQRMIFTPERVNIVAKTHAVIELVQKSYHDKPLRVSVNLPAQPITIMTDPGKLDMVLMNILDNAFKYTPPNGTVALTLKTHGQTASWNITDSGLGIPRQQQKRLFEKFFRADNAIKAQINGTGLGLYLVHKIIEHEHGSLTITSHEDKGTSVTISLPLSQP